MCDLTVLIRIFLAQCSHRQEGESPDSRPGNEQGATSRGQFHFDRTVFIRFQNIHAF